MKLYIVLCLLAIPIWSCSPPLIVDPPVTLVIPKAGSSFLTEHIVGDSLMETQFDTVVSGPVDSMGHVNVITVLSTVKRGRNPPSKFLAFISYLADGDIYTVVPPGTAWVRFPFGTGGGDSKTLQDTVIRGEHIVRNVATSKGVDSVITIQEKELVCQSARLDQVYERDNMLDVDSRMIYFAPAIGYNVLTLPEGDPRLRDRWILRDYRLK